MKQDQPEQESFLGLRLLAICLLALSLIVLYYAFQIRQGAGYSVVGTLFFPLVVVIGLVVFSLLLLLRTTPLFPDHELGQRAAAEAATTHWATVGLIGLALLLYAFTLNLLGYVIATALFFPGVARILDSRQPLRDFIIGLVLSVVIYISFTRFLGVRLPAGLLAGIL
ncbi:MAG: tripartite tricarboxylate transporter TctB family protein [Anaerolineae bacterium]|nr:tripartite tricarboxylate transporter TctB family protein [Anaerolineae bacterium]